MARTKDKYRKMTVELLNVFKSKKGRYLLIFAILLIFASIAGYYFAANNEAYYKKTIAKITSISETKYSQAYDMFGNGEQLYKQEIQAIIMNGRHKEEKIFLQNITSYSKAYDISYKVDDEIFVSIIFDTATKKVLSSKILNFKRDKYIVYIIMLFILLILFIGGLKGIRSLASVIINIIIVTFLIEFYLKGFNLIYASIIASMIFIIISISLVSGINKKTVSAVIGTMAGTLFAMLTTVVVIWLTQSKGMHYEGMESNITLDYEQIFLVEVMIGTLGGIMDIAISISSAIKELYDRNPNIERKVLLKSGMEIGKDIMGTMANTLVFAYISGSIPMILLWLKNGYSTFNVIKFNISLEIMRALIGSIGIVISIPITLHIAVIFLKRKKTGEIYKV
jgi:uncharacterized membrane protein